jgi:site-specific DNA recombinase
MNVGIWIRVSTDDQARGESPKNHEARARMYAEFKGWNVVELYDLSGTSGKAVIETPEAQRMLKDVASGKIQALIFSKLARLARNVRELLDFSDYFQKHNANLVSLEESIDTSTPAGRLLFTVIGALAQWEREEISARCAASVPIRAKQGKPTGGKGQFGYMWAADETGSKRLVPNPKEAPTVKRAYELFLERKKLLPTCKALDAEGLRPRKSRFKNTTLKRILTDPTYKGLRRANYCKSGGNKRAWELKPQSEWVYQEVPPLVSPETWEAVQLIFAERTAKYQAGVPKESRYPFGGLLVCECGKKMYVQRYVGMKVNRYRCMACHNKINEDVITEQFLEGIKAMVVTPEKLEGPKEAEATIGALQERLENARREIQAVNSKTEKLLELWNEGMIDKPTFAERLDGLRTRKEQLANEIPRIQGEIDFIKVSEVGRDYLLARAVSIASMWPLFDDVTKNGLIREIVDSITVGKDSLDFSFTCPPDFMPLEKDTHTRMDAVTILNWPKYNLSLSRPVIPPKGYPGNPKTIGERIRRTRLDRGLTQLQVAKIIGVDEFTVINWELGKTEPQLQCIPKIIEFLGYVPFDCPEDPLGQLKHYKMIYGLNYEELGKVTGKHPEQLMDWLSGRRKPCKRNLEGINAFLSGR